MFFEYVTILNLNNNILNKKNKSKFFKENIIIQYYLYESSNLSGFKLSFMKQQTHPKLSTTIVQMTDGSFFIKKWLFFRDFLSLEVDIRSHSG